MIITKKDHFSHPHELKLECTNTPYRCDGCKELGFGSRYRCDPCNFDLHKDCAMASPSITHHFYNKCNFKFLDHPPGDRYCNACGRDVQGFVYNCNTCGHDLHPCCASLPRAVEGNGKNLILHKKVSSKCVRCGSKKLRNGDTGWSYVSTCGDYHFHVACVKDMAVENWEKGEFGGRCSSEAEMNNLALASMAPRLEVAVHRGGSSSRARKYWKMVKIVLKLIISAILGDPTAGITCLIESLIS